MADEDSKNIAKANNDFMLDMLGVVQDNVFRKGN